MRFSVFTASTPQWTPAEAAVVLAGQGWDGIEWRVTDQDDAPEPEFWAGNRCTWPLTGIEDAVPEIRRITESAGLAYSGIGGYARAGDRVGVERILRATAAIGAGRVRVTTPAIGEADYRDLFAQTRRDLEWVAGRAAHHGVTALVELHHRTVVASASAAVRLVAELDPAHVGVIHDSGNLVIEGQEDTLAGLQMLGGHLAHVHVKNVAWRPGPAAPDGTVPWTHDWATLRQGQVDVAAYFRALADHGYDGWVTVEDFSTVLPLEERTRDNLAYLRAIRERLRPPA